MLLTTDLSLITQVTHAHSCSLATAVGPGQYGPGDGWHHWLLAPGQADQRDHDGDNRH
jgi:hypothetical protein